MFFAQQYEGLETLYQKYGGDGFVVLGFPCNQFGGQEPGTAEDIQNVWWTALLFWFSSGYDFANILSASLLVLHVRPVYLHLSLNLIAWLPSFSLNYGIKFPILGKIDVNGEKASPVYE